MSLEQLLEDGRNQNTDCLFPGLGSGGAPQAFTWLLNLSTVAGLIAWATLCFCYIRFHRALKVQGVSRDSLPWQAPWQPYAAWWGFIGATIITLVAGFPVFLKGNWSVSDFVASYVGIPIFIVPIIIWKLVYKTKASSSRCSGISRSINADLFDVCSSLARGILISGLDVFLKRRRLRRRSPRRLGAGSMTGWCSWI